MDWVPRWAKIMLDTRFSTVDRQHTVVAQKSSVRPQYPNALQHALRGHVAFPGLAGPHCKFGSTLEREINAGLT